MVRAYFSKSSRAAFFLHIRQTDLHAASPLFLFLPSPSSPHALAVDFLRAPQQQVPGRGTRCAPHRAGQLLHPPLDHKAQKIPESSFEKENSGKNSAKQARKKYSVQNKKEQLLHQIFR